MAEERSGSPSYRHLTAADWRGKIDFFRSGFSPCRLCPRACGALREEDRKGVCQAGRRVKIASHNLHFGEEPPISGLRGSGTVFFSGCTLKCVFCQNYPISHLFHGELLSVSRLADIFLHLQKKGAHNINLVSPAPYLFHIIQAVEIASRRGLTIPFVYNTSGYERSEVIRELEGLVDVYLPDLKYREPEPAQTFSGVKNYFEYAFPAIVEMFRQRDGLETRRDGVAVRGTIVRHLILPGQVENSLAVLRAIADSPFRDVHISLMSQYFPAFRACDHPGINRRLQPEEYRRVRDYALELGIENGWFQEI